MMSVTTSMAKLPILNIAGLLKVFGDFTALNNVDLKVEEGEFLAIVGPSGSGKTTLIRLLVGMDEPTNGAIFLRNTRMETMPANKRPTCMVFQSLALFPHMTVGQNIEFPMKIKKLDAETRKARALELLDLLQLPQDYYGKGVHQCSGGERQRVALARALAFDPEILFFDEPLSALDYRLRKTLEKELKDLHARTGKTFIYITHSLEEAMGMSDRIAIMRAGSFEQIAPADEIYTHPVSTFVAEFMGDVNLFDMTEGEEPLEITKEGASSLGLDTDMSGTLMVRPENVKFLADEETDDITLQGVVKADFNLGSRIQYEVLTQKGKKLIVETLRDNQYAGAMNETVKLGWSAASCHVIRETA